MWIFFAFGSAVFAGLTSILAKAGIRDTDSNVATALRTVVVLFFSWIMVFVTGSFDGIYGLDSKTLIFLVLSGLATGASWLCYFHALQIGDVNKVTPVDKSSTILTMILAFLFLGEPITWLKGICIVMIGAGTYLMIQKKPQALEAAAEGMPVTESKAGAGNPDRSERKKTGSVWFLYAAGSALFASLTSILGKVGIEGVDSNLGTAIRTIVVLIMAWLVVGVTGKMHTIKDIDKKSWVFLALSGCATGASWLCYYRALQTGPASVVVPIDKLSIVLTVIFAYAAFGEKLSRRALIGLLLIVAGTLLLLV